MADIDFEKGENKQLLIRLYAYARGLFNQLYEKELNWKGKGFRDYVHDAIAKHLYGEDNYDPDKGPLEYHLKYHLIRQAITNDISPAVKRAYADYRKKNQDQHEMHHKTDIEDPPINPDDIGTVSLAVNSIENELLFKEIELEIQGDGVVEQIYLAVVCDKYHFSERAEICEDFNLQPAEFDKGKRRLMTVLRRVFKKLNINLDYACQQEQRKGE